MTRAARAEINLRALRHNLQCVKQAAPSSRVLAVVKANGYGHGLVRAARALDSADAFAVACLEEAIQLREAGLSRPVVLLEGFFDTQELETFSAHGLQAVVHHESQLELLESTRLKRPISVWLKVDTGMHRLGFAPGAVKGVWQRLRRCASVGDDVRLMTHFAWADDPESPMTDRQARAFEEAVQDLPGERSLANSGAILGWPRTHADWVRPGIMLYGATPFLKGAGADHGLQPAMSLRTELIAVNRCRRGETVGYGGAWVCPEDMPVGVAAAGYGDGYPRHAEAGTPVLVGGRRVTLVGRVSMDMICLDLRGHAEAQVGEEVVLWGEGLPVETVAQHAGTIGYELLCRISPRVAYMETEQ